MQRSIRSRLNDILRAVDGSAETIGDADFETFRTAFHIPRAVERCIEIVSEATRHIPEDIKARYPHIPWPQIAGIGNVLRHDYDIVDDRIIWEVATVHFSALRAVVVEIRSQLPDED
jgi:uncharacterized protein with HEPN domain